MKKLLLAMSVITGILLFSTAVCGLWIRNQNSKLTDYASSVNFHMYIGIATAILGMATMILTILYIRKKDGRSIP